MMNASAPRCDDWPHKEFMARATSQRDIRHRIFRGVIAEAVFMSETVGGHLGRGLHVRHELSGHLPGCPIASDRPQVGVATKSLGRNGIPRNQDQWTLLQPFQGLLSDWSMTLCATVLLATTQLSDACPLYRTH